MNRNERDQERRVALAVVADDLAALLLNESVQAFEDVLDSAGMLHRQPRPQQQEDQDQEADHQHFHGDGIRDRRLGKLRLNVKGAQERVHRPGEDPVQQRGKRKLFRHGKQ